MSGAIRRSSWRYSFSALAAVVGLFAAASPALAAHNSQPVILSQSQTVNHDYFAAGSMVEVDGTVNGDVYAAGGQVIINGTVNGDVLAAGGSITVDGIVNGNVRAAGGTVLIDGHVTKNISVAGGNVVLAHHATIDGSVAAASGSLQDSSSVTGNVNAAAGQLTVGSDAHVGGTVTYWSNQAATIADGAVTGSVTHRIPPARHHAESNWFAGALFMAMYWLAATYVLALLLTWWLPRHRQTVTTTIRQRPWQSLGWGILGVIVTPIVGIVLGITVIGIPLTLSLWALYAVAILLAPVWVIMALQELLSAQISSVNTFVMLLLAAVVYMLITLIPVLGVLFIIITGLVGLGASLSAGYGAYQHLRHKNEI
jgi:cytoskeletal protein CcmA (bactofilin family)